MWQRLKGGTSSALCLFSIHSTKIAIDSALWHEGRGYLEFFNSQTDGYVCTREKRTRGETTEQCCACRPFSFSIAHRMPKAKWRNRVTFHTQLEGKRSHPDHRERLPLFVAVRLSVYNNPCCLTVHPPLSSITNNFKQ